MIKQVLPIQQQQNTIMSVDPILLPGNNPILCFLKWQDLRHKSFVVTMYNYLLCWKSKYIHVSRYMYSTILGKKHAYIQAQIIWSTRRLVKVLLGIQQKFYQMSSRAIFLLLDVQQIFTPSKRCLVGSYFSATRRLVENFYQTSSTKSSTRRLVEQKIWAIVLIDSKN